MGYTTIRIEDEVADRLHELKQRGDSYNDVVRRLLDDSDAGDGPAQTAAAAASSLPDEISVPGSGATADARRAALARMYDHLQDHGSAEKADLLDLVDADRVGYASAESFWSNVVKSHGALAALPGVESPGEGGRRWRYVG